MVKSALLSACTLAAFVPAIAYADEPLSLAATSNWNLHYGDEGCRLSRQFGSDENTVLLAFTKSAPGTSMEVLASGVPLKHNNRMVFAYRFNPQSTIDVRRPLFADTDNGGTLWQFNGGLIEQDEYRKLINQDAKLPALKAAEREAASVISSFSILKGVEQAVTLETGNLTPALEAMDTCLDDLVESWGYDPAIEAGIQSRPEPKVSPVKWINFRDYPDEALRKDFAGAVRFRLGVNEEGRAESCTIQSSYSHPSFPEAVCSAFKNRARFNPARNQAGEPVATYWASMVLFSPH